MPDKTALGISEELRQFIEALVEEVVLEGKTFEEHMKYLQRFCQTEGVDYNQLETHLSDLFETAEELKTHESKASERFLRLLGKECYLFNDKMENIVSAVNTKRVEREEEEAKRRAEEEARSKREADHKTKEETERKAREERDRIAREKAQWQAEIDAERKAREETEQRRQKIADLMAIDLGLPSGTKWANMNVGATKPEEFGGYYAWGETEIKDDYTWESYIHGDYSHCTDIGNLCGTIYDVARLRWGDQWKMPSRDQFQELLNYCKCTPSLLNGVRGVTLKGTNGNYIFLPRAGHKSGRKLVEWENGLDCFYWSGTQSGFAAHEMDYTYGLANIGIMSRSNGLTVRPVKK